MMAKKQSKTREQILAEKREAGKRRYNEMKDDPAKHEELKQKERLKYLKKKEKKLIKPIAEMTAQEKLAKRNAWKKNSKNSRKNKKNKETVFETHTLPISNNENETKPPDPEHETILPDPEPRESPQQEALQLREFKNLWKDHSQAKTKEQILAEKREAEKKRYNKLKDDPIQREELKQKQRLQYLKKKEKKLVKPIAEMSAQEQLAIRNTWRKNAKNSRENKKNKETVFENILRDHTPPILNNEIETKPPVPERRLSPKQEVLHLEEEVHKEKLLPTSNSKVNKMLLESRLSQNGYRKLFIVIYDPYSELYKIVRGKLCI